jgi:hypothetical protein
MERENRRVEKEWKSIVQKEITSSREGVDWVVVLKRNIPWLSGRSAGDINMGSREPKWVYCDLNGGCKPFTGASPTLSGINRHSMTNKGKRTLPRRKTACTTAKSVHICLGTHRFSLAVSCRFWLCKKLQIEYH